MGEEPARHGAHPELEALAALNRELVRQKGAALRELNDLKAQIEAWRAALRPYPDHAQEGEWVLPPGPHLAASPQRYTDNYQKYLDRGGKMRPAEDIIGFIGGDPEYVFDRARFFFFCLAVDLIDAEKVAGDFVELGVHRGNSASVLARAAARLGKSIYLLDTFEGFAEQDLVGSEARHRGAFADAPLELVKEAIAGDHVKFVKGHFPELAAQMPDDLTFCLAHLDCDLYAPFARALDYFWPRLAPGGFLIMHDYTTMHWPGVERACDEFFAGKAESMTPIPDMAGTVVVRKNK